MAELNMDRLALLLHVSESLAKQGNFPHLTSAVNSEIKQMNDDANPTPARVRPVPVVDEAEQKLADKLKAEGKPAPVYPQGSGVNQTIINPNDRTAHLNNPEPAAVPRRDL